MFRIMNGPATSTEQDPVNAPGHYTSGGIETIDYMRAKMTDEQFEGYLKGNIIKYVSRYEMKNGVQDVRKAEWYIKRLINHLERSKTSEQANAEDSQA